VKATEAKPLKFLKNALQVNPIEQPKQSVDQP